MARPGADPTAYDQALEWFRQRVPMTDEEFDAMEVATHERAFKVAGVAQIDLVNDVWAALDSAIAHGDSLSAFQKTVGARLGEAWGGEQPWRVETIFRTNLQHSYSRGRWAQQTDPQVKEMRPYWEFSAILDTRTTDVCRLSHGTIRPTDDGFWQAHNPPCHHNCRSTIISLTPEQAQSRGITPTPPSAPAAEGFGQAPGEDDWTPDYSRFPHELAAEAQAKVVNG